MNLNQTPSSERIHIGFFGKRNAGKSSIVNAITGQNLSVVSDIKGTTTDPVKKAMELAPLGPVVIIDTPGLDDEGSLGALRVEKAYDALNKCNIAVVVIDASVGLTPVDISLINELKQRELLYLTVFNKADRLTHRTELPEKQIYTSTITNEGIDTLKSLLGSFAHKVKNTKCIVSDLLSKNDTVILVTPIDEAAPKGRLILPQQMVLRDTIDAHCTALICQPQELKYALDSLVNLPKIVITDSQAFRSVAEIVPETVPLTSFSILMARYKGDLKMLAHGFNALTQLKDGDKVLICEACTHHRQCNDIGTVKMPKWIEGYSHSKPEFHFTSGGDFPRDLSSYKVIVHCGGCMINETEMKHRISEASKAGIPIVNYGIAIAGMHGILKRSTALFPDLLTDK